MGCAPLIRSAWLALKIRSSPAKFNAPLRKFALEFCNGGSAAKNLASCRYQTAKRDMCIRLHTVPECDGRTDGRVC